MRRALTMVAIAGALAAARPGAAAACDDQGDWPCLPWRLYGGVGPIFGNLGGNAAEETGGVFGIGVEAGTHHGRLHPRIEAGYGLLSASDAGPATVQRAALALGVRVLGFGPRVPDPIVQIHVDAGLGGQWQSYVAGGDVLGGEAAIGLGLLMATPAGEPRRHLLNWLRVRLWRGPGARPAAACAGDCPGVTRDGVDYGVLISWTIAAAR